MTLLPRPSLFACAGETVTMSQAHCPGPGRATFAACGAGSKVTSIEPLFCGVPNGFIAPPVWQTSSPGGALGPLALPFAFPVVLIGLLITGGGGGGCAAATGGVGLGPQKPPTASTKLP